VADSWSHGGVSTQTPELWVRLGYMMLCVDRDLNSAYQLVTWNCVWTET